MPKFHNTLQNKQFRYIAQLVNSHSLPTCTGSILKSIRLSNLIKIFLVLITLFLYTIANTRYLSTYR